MLLKVAEISISKILLFNFQLLITQTYLVLDKKIKLKRILFSHYPQENKTKINKIKKKTLRINKTRISNKSVIVINFLLFQAQQILQIKIREWTRDQWILQEKLLRKVLRPSNHKMQVLNSISKFRVDTKIIVMLILKFHLNMLLQKKTR